MNETTGGNGGKAFAMFLLGTTAGAVTALLMAPRSGRETRKRLAKALQQIQDKASDLSSSVSESFGRSAESDSLLEHASGSGSQDTTRPGAGSSSSTSYPATPSSTTSSSSRSGSSYRSTPAK